MLKNIYIFLQNPYICLYDTSLGHSLDTLESSFVILPFTSVHIRVNLSLYSQIYFVVAPFIFQERATVLFLQSVFLTSWESTSWPGSPHCYIHLIYPSPDRRSTFSGWSQHVIELIPQCAKLMSVDEASWYETAVRAVEKGTEVVREVVGETGIGLTMWGLDFILMTTGRQ